MSDFLTVLLVAAALWGVGAALTLGALPASLQHWWLVVGLSPLVIFGAVFTIASLASVVGLDVTAPVVAVIVVAAAVVALVLRWRSICWRRVRPGRSEMLEVVALVAVAGVALYTWWNARGSTLLLPNFDAQNHALFVRRILEEGTLDPARIVVNDPATEVAAAQYYPLSLHLLAAFVVRFGTLAIPTALFAVSSLVVAVAWPVGVYSLTKVTVPWRWAPVTAAAFASTALQFPYKPISWGGMTTIVGLSLVPIVAAVTLLALRNAATSAVPVIGFSMGSLFVLHNSQMIAAAILIATIGAPLVFRRATRDFLSVRAISLFAVMFLVPTITVVPSLVVGAQERDEFPVFFGDIASLVGQMLTLSMNSPRSTILPLLFVLLGTAVASATKSGRSVVLAYVVFASLVVVAGLDQWWTSPFAVFVSPWYSQYERVAYYLVIPVAILGAIAVCGGGQLLLGRLSRLRAGTLRRVSMVGLSTSLVVVVVAITFGNARNLNAAAAQDFDYWQVLDMSTVDAAAQLADEEGRPVRILAANPSGAVWLYVLDPRLEVLGPFYAAGDIRVELEALVERLPLATEDSWVDDRLAHYGVDYVFTNGWGFNGAPSAPSETDLDANPCFELVAQMGDDRLWSVCDPA